MKKVLFATTALVATAGVAAADVNLSGWAEMGIVGGDAVGETQFHTGVDVRFTLSGETDNGLTFGATIDLDEAARTQSGQTNAAQNTKATVFVSGNFGTVTMGDTDGALDWAMTEVGVGSTITDDHTTHAGYNGNSTTDGTPNGNVLRYEYTAGDFGVAVSAQKGSLAADDTTWGLGVRYNVALGGADVALGLGYTDVGANSVVGVSASTTFANGLSATLNYSDLDGTVVNTLAMDSHWAIGLGYTTGALTLGLNYGEYSGVAAADDRDGFGVSANYDLGGGAVVQFGYTDDRLGATAAKEESWSLGLAMSF